MEESTAVAKKQKTWQEVLNENKTKFAMALPKVGLTPDRVIRAALTAMDQSKGGALKRCDPKTIIASLIQACEVGLSVSNTLGHAYLVPFKNSEKGTTDCTLIIGYRGFLTLMKRSNEVSDIKSTIVFDKEPFEMAAGDRPYLKHVQLPPATRGDKIVGAYAVVLFRDGTSTFEWMWLDDILKLKKRSKASSSGPWITDEEEMIKKCPIRRIAKRMPMSADFAQRAAVIDEYNEAGIKVGDMFVDDEPEKPLEESVKPAVSSQSAETPELGTEVKAPDEVLPPETGEEKKNPSTANMISSKQVSMIQVLFSNLGIKDDAARHAVVGVDILGLAKAITSLKELTKEQASICIKWLQNKEQEMSNADK